MVPARSNTTNGMVRNRDREGEGESVVTVPQSASHAIAQFPAWVRTLSWLPTETASQNGTALPSRGQQRKPANKCVRIIVRTYISCSSISRRSRSSLVLDVASWCCEWEKKKHRVVLLLWKRRKYQGETFTFLPMFGVTFWRLVVIFTSTTHPL